MAIDDVALHNVGGAVRTDDGVRLERISEDVRAEFNERSQEEYQRPDGVEIRFVSEGPVCVTLSCPRGTCEVTPFWGPFQLRPDEHVTVSEEPTTIEMSLPERVTAVDRNRIDGRYFAPEVGRLVCFGNPTILHGVSGSVRPPRADELPDERLLTYGTSITQGAFASRYPMSFGHQTARLLGKDHVNLGSGGSAFCENALADTLAGRDDWDQAVLAVSVNMIATGFDAETFYDRAAYLVDTVASARPEKPVVAVTLFPLFTKLCPNLGDGDEWEATPAEYREALRQAVEAADRDNLHLIEGPDLLRDAGGLSADLLHPMDHGMTEIAHRLSKRLTTL
jgi:hypothetical protein